MSILNSIKKLFNPNPTDLASQQSTAVHPDKETAPCESEIFGKHMEHVEVHREDGSVSHYYYLGGPMGKYYSLLDKLRNEKDIYRKIELCEESYKVLPDTIKIMLEEDAFIPPSIPCRDIGPKLYIRTGQWERAEKAVRTCIEADAYYPKDGTEALKHIQQFCQVGKRIIAYVSENPGCLQKDIYKAVGITPDEKDDAKYFCRYSLQLIKKPYKNTNKLYV